MLPQFGYIVAQAGADSRPPPTQPLYSHPRSPPQSTQPPQQQQQEQHSHHQQEHQLQKQHGNGSAKETNSYYNNTRSPLQGTNSIHPNKTNNTPSIPILPPPPVPPPAIQKQTSVPPPYMYSSKMPPTASSNVDNYHYYSNKFDQRTNTGSFRPLQPSSTTYPWQPHDPYMDHPYRVPPPTSSKTHHAFMTSQPPPHTSSKSSTGTYLQMDVPSTYDTYRGHYPSHDIIAKDTSMYESPYYTEQPHKTRWHQEDTLETNDSKMFRRLREYNDLMTWMDNEFWEQNDEVYTEKLQALQKELQSIQDGDHAAFQEMVTDLEMIRDQTIENALCFEYYQLTMTKQEFDLDVMMIEDEFQNEMHHLNDVLMLVIDEHRKQIKEDREDSDQLDMDGIFQEAYERIKQKRSLRKRTLPSNSDRGSPARQETTSSRGRRLKNNVTPHNINAPLSSKEEEDVDAEYMMMKGILPKRNGGSSNR